MACASSNAGRRISCRCRMAAICSPARAAPSARSQNSVRKDAAIMPPIRPRWAASARCCAALCSRRRLICCSAISPAPWANLGKLAGLGKRLWQADGFRSAFNLFRKSAGDTLDRWFESDPIKAVLGFDAVVGNLASPYTPGSAYVLLHHTFGEVNGKQGVWGHAIGGMGAITQAMAQGRRRIWRGHRSTLAGARSDRGARPCRRNRARRRRSGSGQYNHRQCRSAKPIPDSGAARSGPADAMRTA